MAVVNGTNLVISLGGTVIANSQEVSLSLNHDVIDVTTKDSAGVRELIAGQKSGSMSCSGLQEYSGSNGIKLLADTFDTGAAVALIFDQVATGGNTFSANGILTSLEMSGGTDDAPTYSASFELTGAITKALT
jgi:TP901-1 family phage major tail protein